MENLDPDNFFSAKAAHDYKLVVLAVNNNDQKAFAELMSRYWDPVFFMLQKMVLSKDDAEDLTIEAFGKAFRNIHQYTPSYAFSTWLFKIASNNAIDFIRKKKLQNLTSLDRPYENQEGEEISQTVKSDVLNPEESVIKKQKFDHIKVVIEKLKPRYRELIQLRYYEELSYEEIGDRLSLPVGTVKAQLFRARDLLASLLKDSEKNI